ncbi:hypothetical protein JOQ06_003394 [Pogonophryne albipinna]|uniref:Uncharacterized protein n=1 Tax=Pogonophryne albipinna TaxID=1090488 RepID=A0AAD6A9F2_9TELE|nr:hypothetical protein JOQ06_003394 [Pogonophryne albipinna]
MMSWPWTHIPLVLVLVLSVPQVSSGRGDRTLISEEFVGAVVNASVLDGRGHAVQTMSSEAGTYGQNSPKVDTRGVVLSPSPVHGGNNNNNNNNTRGVVLSPGGPAGLRPGDPLPAAPPQRPLGGAAAERELHLQGEDPEGSVIQRYSCSHLQQLD